MNSRAHSRPTRIAAALVAFSSLLSTPVFAACTQDRGVYTDRDDAYTLTFENAPDDQAAANKFSIQMNDGDLKLDGSITRSGNDSRPDGVVTYKCPEGNLTKDELNTCKVWQGVVYALTEGADATLLPGAKEPAAQALLLPDFSSSMSNFNFDLETPIETFPWEVFRFKECVPEE